MALLALRAAMVAGFAVVGGSAVHAVRSLVARQWRRGLKLALIVGASFLIGVAAMGALGVAYSIAAADFADRDPSRKARVLGETISTEMNFAAIGLGTGTALAIIMLFRRRPIRRG